MKINYSGRPMNTKMWRKLGYTQKKKKKNHETEERVLFAQYAKMFQLILP